MNDSNKLLDIKQKILDAEEKNLDLIKRHYMKLLEFEEERKRHQIDIDELKQLDDLYRTLYK